MKKLLFLSVIVIALFMWDCNRSKKMCGVYVCKEHFDPTMIDNLKLDINIDGTIELVGETMNSSGTYEAFGDSLFIKTDFYDMRLLVKKNSLVGYNVLYVKAGL